MIELSNNQFEKIQQLLQRVEREAPEFYEDESLTLELGELTRDLEHLGWANEKTSIHND